MDAAPPLERRVQPLVHVEHMPSAVRFYELLGGHVTDAGRDGNCVLMQMAGGQVSERYA